MGSGCRGQSGILALRPVAEGRKDETEPARRDCLGERTVQESLGRDKRATKTRAQVGQQPAWWFFFFYRH